MVRHGGSLTASPVTCHGAAENKISSDDSGPGAVIGAPAGAWQHSSNFDPIGADEDA